MLSERMISTISAVKLSGLKAKDQKNKKLLEEPKYIPANIPILYKIV